MSRSSTHSHSGSSHNNHAHHHLALKLAPVYPGVDHIKEVLSYFSINGNIKVDEFPNILRMLGRNPYDLDIKNIISHYETQSKTVLPLEEFLYALIDLLIDLDKSHGSRVKQVQQALSIFDKEKDGLINVADMQQLLVSVGDKLTGSELMEIMSELTDEMDESGRVPFDVICNMISFSM
eukprot:TRINITY_DN1366_c0_g1_i1.p1 TRINITY_DN1366_c0_g1~~TRINITY_DN1366_c0_g1_i1.p1  ORF type:complete len:179 (+),score=29.92 TRINITY_DN1366_c0_g1_i1:80-616(+)